MRLTAPSIVAALVASGALATPALAASDEFGLDYRVERRDAGRFSIESCIAAAQTAADAAGLVTTVDKLHPGELGVLAAGPRGGGGSLIVYCIGVDRKTVFVVQAMDYMRRDSAAASALADSVHGALMKASR
ncbi:hypothetical protein JOD31_003078 [Methylopila capsulata]|uniref:Uncharacterized protein n=1 Tax=Methylopila capsulata TaxID=61654 RepID=A0A9W6IXN4_9HYPH|nr:DUF6180 family protein [Methylopila capsulata]MBM7852836.1 hypothetical protein [Methylopila capsulata]GLK57045.1 hypothetical protein GCM10008170_30640 [Methylopila capsulata]